MNNEITGEDKHKQTLDINTRRREIMLQDLFKEEGGMMATPDVKNMRIANEIMTAQEASTLKQMEMDQKGAMLGEVSENVAQMFKELASAPLLKPLTRNKKIDDKEYDVYEDEIKEVEESLRLEDFQRDRG